MKALKNNLLSSLLVFLVFASFSTLEVRADVIVDNGDSGTSSNGTWSLSGGLNPYGDNSLWARDGATYTWSFDSQPAGSYEVLIWWSQWPSRATDIDVVINYFGSSEIIGINQQENTGQWNSLGTYNFGTSGSVTITAANGSTVSTCADAVWFRSVSTNTPPTAVIDSISPSPADVGESVSFAGYGEDVDGTIGAYNWTSSIDDFLSDANSFSTEFLSEGVHIISFRVQDNNDTWSETVTEILTVGQPPTETIIDNLDADISWTGTWNISGGPNPYEADSFWSRDGSTFTWYFTPAQTGEYEISMWWTQFPSRSDSAPVEIEHSTGTDTVTINQQQDGGQWNVIDNYILDEGVSYSITITSQSSPSSTCADAVKCVYLGPGGGGNIEPTATIDSISPNPADVGESVSFAGYGEDVDGTIGAYNWTSSIDDFLSDANSFSTEFLSEGVHTISFRVQDNNDTWSETVTDILTVGQPPTETIIDNLDADISWTGTWNISSGTNPYEADSFWSRDGDTFTWYFTPAQTGEYEVSMWWTQHTSRSDSVPVEIEHSTGTDTVTINQQQDGGQWNVIDNYVLDEGVTYSVTITSQPGPSSTCADAVKCVYLGPGGGNIEPTATIDSISPNPASVGETISFSGYGTDSDGTIIGYNWSSSIEGDINDLSSFSMDSLSQGQHTISFSVQDNEGMWSDAATEILVISGVVAPTAIIDSITPNPADVGQQVLFVGSGIDSDGTIEAYDWSSSIDGDINDLDSFSMDSLTPGQHIISLRVQDDDGLWSEPVTEILTVGQPPSETIVDNLDADISWSGTWSISGGADPYGADSFWSRNGSTFTWYFTPAQNGEYEVSMWWTDFPSRSDSVAVNIGHSAGTGTAYINQQQDGGQWNPLGSYVFLGGVTYTVMITANTDSSSTCADAIRCVYLGPGGGGNITPTATIDSISPNPAQSGLTVYFTGYGTDSDGTIANYNWRSSINGYLSNLSSFSRNNLSTGTHTIYFSVQDNNDIWSQEVSRTLDVTGVSTAEEHIYISPTYGGPESLTPLYVSALQNMGASQQGNTWVYTNQSQGKTYVIHFLIRQVNDYK